jgi:formate hydrogenlyase subunit 3/multisubunit Na+/H+ antiporter MnhD subunit
MNNLLLLIALPLITAFLLPIIDRVSVVLARVIGPVVLVITSAIGISLWMQLGDQAVAIQLGGFLPPLGITFYADRLSVLFAVIVSVGTLLLWPDDGEDRLRQSVLSLILVAAGSGAGSLAATMRYLIISAFGAVLALAGIALVYQATGTLNLAQLAQLAPTHLNNTQGLAAFVLMLVGFGVWPASSPSWRC